MEDFHTNTWQDERPEKTSSRTLPQVPGARPIVDPKAEGIVDPNLYPEPKEATHKIRGKNDFMEYLFGSVDQELLTVKTFYFFFYSAFGSLFPLMGVYFKQMGMNAGQCGLLIGLRPFIEFFSAPFWGSWADRWQKGKPILLASLSCWIIFTLPLGFIQPPATSCMILTNHTYYLYIPDSNQRIVKRSVSTGNKIFTSKASINIDTINHPKRNTLKYSHYITADRLKKTYQIRPFNYLNINLKKLRFVKRQLSPILVNQTTVSQRSVVLTADSNESTGRKNMNSTIKYMKLSTMPIKITSKKRNQTSLHTDNNLKDSILHLHNVLSNFKNGSKENDKLIEPDLYLSNEDIINNDYQNQLILKQKEFNNFDDTNITKIFFHRSRRSTRFHVLSSGQSPLSVSFAENYKEKEHKEWVKPQYSSIVYKLPDIQKTFFLLLMLVIVGEFFSAPAITLADSAVITLLGEDADRYGHQRMFGSLGWGVAMFFVGIALDHSTAFPDHPCGPDTKEKNYTICFAIFSVLMGAALITATQINFKYDPVPTEPVAEKYSAEPSKEEQLQNQLSQQLNLPNLQDSPTTNVLWNQIPMEEKTKMFAQTTREIPEWVTILKQFRNLKCASFLFVAWFMGFGIGLIFTFLFWHLQDYGGTPTLFGVASVINHISEIFAYFFSFKLIRQVGHVKVLCLGLGGNVLRFLYISWLKNPWWVLPFEFIQGITHATVWAACCSYIAHNTPTPLRSSAQGVLQGLHHGLGRGCGAVIGGMFVAVYGTTVTFRAYGILCLIVLGAFIFINFYRKDTGFVSDLPQSEDPHQVAEVTHLAPHGVPSNAVPRALSSHRLHELSNQDVSYGATYQTSSGNLTIPGGSEVNPNNPFLNHTGQTTSSSYNIPTKIDEDFIRRNFQSYDEIISANLDSMKIPPMPTQLLTQQPCTNPFHQHDYEW